MTNANMKLETIATIREDVLYGVSLRCNKFSELVGFRGSSWKDIKQGATQISRNRIDLKSQRGEDFDGVEYLIVTTYLLADGLYCARLTSQIESKHSLAVCVGGKTLKDANVCEQVIGWSLGLSGLDVAGIADDMIDDFSYARHRDIDLFARWKSSSVGITQMATRRFDVQTQPGGDSNTEISVSMSVHSFDGQLLVFLEDNPYRSYSPKGNVDKICGIIDYLMSKKFQRAIQDAHERLGIV